MDSDYIENCDENCSELINEKQNKSHLQFINFSEKYSQNWIIAHRCNRTTAKTN